LTATETELILSLSTEAQPVSETDTADPPGLIEPQDVANRLGVSLPVVYELMDSGKLRCVDISRNGRRKYRRTTEGWLAEFLTSGPREAANG
jgi:excisionase family DNA binding protein